MSQGESAVTEPQVSADQARAEQGPDEVVPLLAEDDADEFAGAEAGRRVWRKIVLGHSGGLSACERRHQRHLGIYGWVARYG